MDGFPNSRTSLLHQKLQMLNVCIDRRRRRDEAAMAIADDSSSSSYDEDNDEEDDEFYECEDDRSSTSSDRKKAAQAPLPKPSGRLGKFGNLTLLKCDPEEPMYVPLTQEPVPKTEDQLDQDTEAMLSLGTDKVASEIRATIMSPSLLSDMESFKAANPQAAFEDFIRWYSPKDWIDGHLSTRMVIPDNVWVQLWSSARCIPAKRQKRLFDDTTEAEKTLHFFETRSVAQAIDLMIPSLTHAIVSKVGEECKTVPELPQLEKAFAALVTLATKLTRDRVEVSKYKGIAEAVYNIELAVARLKSLRVKFGEDAPADFLRRLAEGQEAQVAEASLGPIGTRIQKMFRSKDALDFSDDSPQQMPAPVEREFVLRVMAHRPASSSAATPQMMRAILKKDEFRILGAFTEDLIFS